MTEENLEISKQYYLLLYDDKKFGPFTKNEVLHFINYDKVDGSTPVWHKGQSKWQPLEKYSELTVKKTVAKNVPLGLYIRVNYGRYFLPIVIASILYMYFIYVPSPTQTGLLKGKLSPTSQPKQELNISLKPFTKTFSNGAANIKSIAKYSITARVLATERYYLDWQSNIAEVDLALGWGVLADESTDKFISYRQNSRWYFFEWDREGPISSNDITKNSSNHHIIPANENIRRAVHSVGKNDVILLEGFLVQVLGIYKNKRISWSSSVSREDSGNGACEIMYVTSLGVNGKIYN